MIYIDSRKGSGELLPLFPKGMATLTRLQFADFFFFGRGLDEVPLSIGFERKTITDLIDSLLTGRLSGHQLPGLFNSYDIVYLITEGLWRPNPENGILERNSRGRWATIRFGTRTFMAREIYNYLNTLAILSGVHNWFTATPKETTFLIRALLHWWNDKPISGHTSHLKPHLPFCTLRINKRPIVQRMVMELPGLGIEKARLATKKFKTVLDMILATEEDWRDIEGIGDVLSKRIVKSLQEGEGK